ncbi:MAG: ABC transporter ATP-binding protein [Lachnospiraceae bacterium]|nr:ABC transporter ATP-binding protein [Lachnospiraceae bacterium]
MKINLFLKNICGRKLYFQIAFAILLAFGTATAQFLAAQHLGNVIDAVEKGYRETMYHVFSIAASLTLYIPGTAALTFLSGKISAGFSRSAQLKIGMKICSAQYQELERMNDGDLLSMIAKDIDSIRSWIGLVMRSGYLPVCLGLIPVCLFRWCNWKFSLLALCMIPLNAVPSIFFASRLSPFHDREKKAYARVLSHFTDSLQFAVMIKAFQLEQTFQDEHKAKLDQHRNTLKKRVLFEKLTEEYGRSYGHISRILLLLLSAYFIFRGEMTLGRLTSVILCADFIGEGLKILGNIPLLLPPAKAAVNRMQTLLELPDESLSENKTAAADTRNGIPVYEVHGLSFSYGDVAILQNIHFRVYPGEKIAVVGLSGCGKTTLFKLLGRLYTPEKNQIYFKGMDISALTPEYMRAHITVTTQEAFLFQATFMDNVKVAKSDGSEEEIIAACKNARLDSFIQTLPEAYDTEVNTTVQSISNGQMQRINLARAFLRDTDVFLLDEPVSALDSVTAGAIWNYLFSECTDKTLLIILHDLEEVCRFHKVLVLDQGKVAAFGTHKELIQSCELYKNLYKEKMKNRRKAEA